MKTKYNKATYEIAIKEIIRDFCKEELNQIIEVPHPLNNTWISKWYNLHEDQEIRFFLSPNSFLFPLSESKLGEYFGATRLSPFLTFDEMVKNEPLVFENISHPLIQYTLISTIPLSANETKKLTEAIQNIHQKKFNSPLRMINIEVTGLLTAKTAQDLKDYL